MFGATAYISYARADERRVQVVSQLHQAFANEWVHLKVDANEVQPRESFEDFINEIGKADCVVVVFSESYLRSFYCMLELTRILRHGNAVQRVYPVFAEDGFRLDGVRQHWKNYWQDKFDHWHNQSNDEPDEVVDAFGSVDECNEILANLDSVFEHFARCLAGQVPACNAEVIGWVKQIYFRRIEENPVFQRSIRFLRSCHDKVRMTLNVVLDEHLDETQGQSGELSGKPEKIVPFLVQLPIPELLNIFNQAQEFIAGQDAGSSAKRYLQELSQLLQYLVPLLFQPEAVKNLQHRRTKGGSGIVVIPCASEVSAEILMAGVDRRATDFGCNQLDSGQMMLCPGKYCLPLPPESGIAGVSETLKDVDTDLAQRMGLDAVDEDLFERFVKQDGVEPKERYLLVKDELEFLRDDGQPGYYWILNSDGGGGSQRWSALADELSKRYPEILLLSLDSKQLREERRFFRMLHKVVPRHLSIEG
ncbi:hypothetical protein Thini_3434 [Thiothrix nivea DSM 5205]|uniref:TIR domain-containing protein n=1 Tax=Thiothrix nivea (strain ATCC 35100 / DSM 5205 / JP2) TaxID=870187 RepID=A0A656HKA7_THINJ|nr:hypothetical protein Thini_3434 [Thiothrix nivea DSM 5205]